MDSKIFYSDDLSRTVFGNIYWHFVFLHVSLDNFLPGLFFHWVYLVEQMPLLSFLGLPRIRLNESQFGHFLMLHQSTLHPTLQILHLIIPAPLGYELMFLDALGVLFGLHIALMEMIERERSFIWCLCHSINILCIKSILIKYLNYHHHMRWHLEFFYSS